MKRSLQILLLLFLTSLTAFSQIGPCEVELIPKYDKRKKMWGFSNLMGFWEIQPFYTKVSPFVENKSVVMKGLSYGVIDCQGNVVVPFKYDQITNFRNGKAWVNENGKWGLVDYMGRMLLSPMFSEIFPIESTEVTWVLENDVWGLFNEGTRRMVCKPQFKVAKVLSPNSSMIQVENGLFGVVNHVNCRFLIEPKISHVKKVNVSTVLFEIDNKWGVFSYDGRIRANAEYDSIRIGSANLLVFQKGRKEGLMDLSGKIIQEAKFDKIGEYSEGLFPYLLNGKYGYINLLGKIYFEPQFEEASVVQDKQAVVKVNGKEGVVNLKKEYILKPQFASIKRSKLHPFYVVSQKQEKGLKEFLFDLKGQQITKGFDEIMISDSTDLIRVKNSGRVSFIKLPSGKAAFEESFDNAKPFSYGYSFFEKNGKWGAIDKSGNVVLSPDFDSVEYFWFTNRLVFKTQNNGKAGIAGTDGKVIFPTAYQKITPSTLNFLKVKKGGKFGVCKTDGSVVYDPVYDFMSNSELTPETPEWPAIVSKDGKFGLLDEKNGETIKPSASLIYYSGENVYVVKERKKFQAVNAKGEELRKVRFDSIGYTGDGRIAVFNGKKWGYVNFEGKDEVDFLFDEAGKFINRVAIVKKDGKFGVINFNGEFVKKPKFTSWRVEDGKRFLIDGENIVPVDQ